MRRRNRQRGLYHRRLHLEQLEDRRVLATVTTLSDVVDSGDGVLSLREAIAAAASGETIDFAVTGTISLSSLGQLVINKNLTINGPGANLLTIKAYDPDAAGTNDGDGSRVFEVNDGDNGTFLDVELSGLTLTNGDYRGVAGGGGIRNLEYLTLNQMVVKDNFTGGDSATGENGGGIRSGAPGVAASLTIIESTISANRADNGGGIAVDAGELTLIDSTISDNVAMFSSSIGGGILSISNSTIRTSTISGNRSNLRGGGIYAVDGLTIDTSTISGNQGRNGGGIWFDQGTLGPAQIKHSTITLNRGDQSGVFGGAGIRIIDGSVTLNHTIVANNRRSSLSGNHDDIWGAVTASHSLIGSNANATITNSGGNLIGTSSSPINAKLDALALQGGPTATHALRVGSPAIDAGNASAVAGVTVPNFDQRGFPRISNGGVNGTRIDIGAFERIPFTGTEIVVDSLADEADGDYSVGDMTLREAITFARIEGIVDVFFDPSLTSAGPATILLTRGQLSIESHMFIHGPGADLLTIDASGNDPTPELNNGDGSRVVQIFTDDGLMNVTISDLSFTGGDINGAGGGISNSETFTLIGSRVFQNSARDGAGISSANEAATIIGSTFDSNVGTGANNRGGGALLSNTVSVSDSTFINNSSESGGGLYFNGGSLFVSGSTFANNSGVISGGLHILGNLARITNSTFSSNTATSTSESNAGAIKNFANQLWIEFSTIVENEAISSSATKSGGILGVPGDVIHVRSSIISNNDNGDVVHETGSNPFVSEGFNLIGAGISAGVFTNNDLTGVSDPGVAPLADNGGPTMTHALLPNSLARNAGNPSAVPGENGVPNFDQRGSGFPRIMGGQIDIGAYELFSNAMIVDTLVDESDGDFSAGDFSLREAIEQSNAMSGAQEISFHASLVGGTISLSLGELVVSDDLRIGGPGAAFLTIDASGFDATPGVADGLGSRIFTIDDGDSGSTIEVEITGLTLTGGDPGASGFDLGDGGAIRNFEQLTVTASVITGNSAVAGSGARGGAIYNGHTLSVILSTISNNYSLNRGGGIFNYDTLTISDSTISGNHTGGDGASGGAIFNYGNLNVEGSTISGNWTSGIGADGGAISGRFDEESLYGTGAVSITDSTLTGNYTTGDDSPGGSIAFVDDLEIIFSTLTGNSTQSGNGGAIYSRDGTALIDSSTLNGNTVESDHGGAIYVAETELTIVNSTLSGNSSSGLGGALFANAGISHVQHTTVTANTATQGGGIYSNGSDLTVDHTILASNIATGVGEADLAFSLGDTPTIVFSLVSTNSAPIDPRLAPLADNGGPTLTHALLDDSPAIEAGDVSAAPAFEQRGAAFPRLFGRRADIGAFESRIAYHVVDTLVDESDGDYSLGDYSLREAIERANSNPGTHTITFDPSIHGGTILLELGELTIDSSLGIVGPGADLITIDASGNDDTPEEVDGLGTRVFSIVADITKEVLISGVGSPGTELEFAL